MEEYAVYLQPKGSFVSRISSDTLFGAICWAIRVLEGANVLEEMLVDFNDKPRFVVSSTFPYLQANGEGRLRVRFFPMPQLPEPRSRIVEVLAGVDALKGSFSLEQKRKVLRVAEGMKKLKKVRHLSEGLFRDVVETGIGVKELYERLHGEGPYAAEMIGEVVMYRHERERIDPGRRLRSFMREVDVQRNQIDRVAGATVGGLLFLEKQTFLQRHGGGLWFAIKTSDLAGLKPAFRYLQDTGIGGERTVGKGHFNIPLDQIELITLPRAQAPNAFITLSRYLPNDGELDTAARPLNYTLLNLRAKHESMFSVPHQPIYKEPVRVFAEGSIFPIREQREFFGKIQPVGRLEDRTVWQNGMAFPVFTKIGG